MYLSDRDFHPHCQRDKNSKDPCLSWRETRFSYQTSLGQTSSLKRLAAISQVTRERCFSTVLTSQPRRRKRATYCIRWAPWNFFALARSSSSADAQPAPHAGYRYTSIAKVVDRQEQSAFSLPYATRSRWREGMASNGYLGGFSTAPAILRLTVSLSRFWKPRRNIAGSKDSWRPRTCEVSAVVQPMCWSERRTEIPTGKRPKIQTYWIKSAPKFVWDNDESVCAIGCLTMT